jgi:hypothetical protein
MTSFEFFNDYYEDYVKRARNMHGAELCFEECTLSGECEDLGSETCDIYPTLKESLIRGLKQEMNSKPYSVAEEEDEISSHMLDALEKGI